MSEFLFALIWFLFLYSLSVSHLFLVNSLIGPSIGYVYGPVFPASLSCIIFSLTNVHDTFV